MCAWEVFDWKEIADHQEISLLFQHINLKKSDFTHVVLDGKGFDNFLIIV